MQADSVENIFARSWTLLTRNPVLLVPGLIVGIVVGVISFIVTPPYVVGGDPSLPFGGVDVGRTIAAGAIRGAVGVLAYLITQTFTVGMAGAAWERGVTTLADGAASFRQDAGRLLGAVLLVGIIGIVLTMITLGIGWLIFLFFAIYTIPAVVLDDLGAVAALRASFRLATRRFGTTVIIVILLFVLGLVTAFMTLPLRVVPLLGPVLAAVITQAFVCFSTLVVTGEYLVSRRAAAAIPPGPYA